MNRKPPDKNGAKRSGFGANRKPPDPKAVAKRAALNALKRAQRQADRAGVKLSDWEGEFLGSVTDRLKTYGTWQTKVVKLADRLHNLRTLDACEPAKRVRKRAETREYYLPMATGLVTQVPRDHLESIVKMNVELDSLSSPAG